MSKAIILKIKSLQNIMTKKDFELIASCVSMAHWVASVPSESKGMSKVDIVEYVAVLLKSQLQQKNPRFDGGRFLKACGVENNDNNNSK